MNFNVGVLAGESILGHRSDDGTRFEVVKALNEGQLDGIVISAKVGGCGSQPYWSKPCAFYGQYVFASIRESSAKTVTGVFHFELSNADSHFN